ncbi:MAG TPA: efflux RND transporter periplasmic adaptor subunit [Candidatus Hydrogenedens sp.]|nr:efflux RND transporter periplasmic adaptor subunit [Candidatus Hydrogenedens sp.]
MSNNVINNKSRIRKKYLLLLIVLIVVIFVSIWIYRGSFRKSQSTSNVLYPVTKGNLEITIIEGGSVEAKESLQIKSEVRGETKILSIVEEGYFVTQEDVQNGKILIELDTKNLLDQQTEQELKYQNAKANLANAEEQYEIQRNQNEIDVRQAELDVKFARMEVEKYLGISTSQDILKQIGADDESIKKLIIAENKEANNEVEFINSDLNKNDNESRNQFNRNKPINGDNPTDRNRQFGDKPINGDSPIDRNKQLSGDIQLDKNNPIKGSKELYKSKDGNKEIEDIKADEQNATSQLIASITSEKVDFRKYADPSLLGDGNAQQNLQKYTSDVILSEEDVKLAQKTLEGTRRLFEKGFVTQTDLETDELVLKRKQVSLEQANTTKSLFMRYEFPKQAEKLVAEYIEAVWKLVRLQKVARSRLAQSDANLSSAKAQFALESRKKREVDEQIEKCTIRATKPGLVVYGGNEDRFFMQEQIKEGTTVRERQIIITIPNTNVMQVRTKIHESNIKRVKQGQKVKIRVDAFPEELLTGAVEKVSVLPNAQNRWMNPDLKVYDTFITIEGNYSWLKPGMTAQAEILVANIENVLYVPLQSVFNVDNQQVCYVQKGNNIEMRVVKTGEFNDSFVEIKEGLEEGEKVLLYIPGQSISARTGKNSEDKKEKI